MIALRDLTKAYRSGFSRTFVLRHINLEIDQGEFVTIHGPSGAGKTTLLHIKGLLDELSVGQQQLVGGACALTIEPHVILADEQTGTLQSRQSEQIMETMQRLNEEEDVTIVQVTHSEKLAKYGQRLIKLDDGWIEADSQIVVAGAPMETE